MLSPNTQPIIDRAKSFIEAHSLLPEVDTPAVGIALSGGADSVALLLLAIELGWAPIALHCNFHLRAEESDRDQRFCEELCRKLSIPFITKQFDTNLLRNLPEHRGKSIEMLCRDLRYSWFRQIAEDQKVTRIALGHHIEDNVETAMLNALRRCGLAGVKGMLPFSGNLYIRPMLCLTKAEILTIVADASTGFVEDSTNSQNDFLRNRLRNIILPTFEQHFPGAVDSLGKAVENLRDDWQLFESLIDNKRKDYIGDDMAIDLDKMIRSEKHPRSLLFHLLDQQMDRAAVNTLFDNIDNSGKLYHLSDGREYLLDRQRLIPAQSPITFSSQSIYPSAIWKEFTEVGTDKFQFDLGADRHLILRIIPRQQFQPRRDPAYAWFSADLAQLDEILITTPLPSDRMRPFGMAGSRLLSDIFTDAKLSRFQKESQLTLRCADGILWLPDMKNSALYPVDGSSPYIFEFHIE